jgi:histone H2B
MAPKMKRGAKNAKDMKKRRRNKSAFNNYHMYIFRVLKQIHPEQVISKKAMSIMNSFVSDVFERVSREAGSLCRYNSTRTLGSGCLSTPPIYDCLLDGWICFPNRE